ncbi:adenosylcobinamide-GDP ribazoletransferase [Pseudonocardia dioxanivorans]|uniref:adenosylcobinamide-GDP ribazoletransferase n=1 Tax=Pseudonocardia dioxanivorans TaxID=240495 RepID=UPI000CD27E2E|nr:adenosylcobinamide-GDP ribazoletransferase [Pseudonocardia dioxanivorans]
MTGLRLALTWLTVVPVPAPEVDPPTAAAALRWAPVLGAVVGAAAGGLALGLAELGVPGPACGLLAVGLAAVLTRAMHLDGLGDVADGLGCYGPPQRALQVMRDGGAGPFAVVTLVVVVGVQAAAFAALPADALAVVLPALAAAVGRTGIAWCARRGVAAARPGGLGATVAGSQPRWFAPAAWLLLAGAGIAVFRFAGVERWWLPVVAVVAATSVVAALSRHTTRRFGGMTGDVLGAASELGGAVCLIVLVAW